MTGIYFHIPFCAGKCPYCGFFSVPYQRDDMECYVRAIIRNIAAYEISDTVDTLYFGGGTPSLLRLSEAEQILEACRKHFRMAENAEITMEWNPTGHRKSHLYALRRLGINRLSIGTQSFSDVQLRLLGRTHTAADGQRTVMDAYDAGFSNISCDLMLACPDQSESVLGETMQILTSLPITHVSAYLLQIEDGTPLSRNTNLLKHLPDGDEAADRYMQAVHTLRTAGFAQYEVSSFAREGFESRHNLKYWRCEPYLGIGAGAHSCFQGKRFFVPEDIPSFCRADVQPTEILDAHPCGRKERLMLALRTREGVEISEFTDPSVLKLLAGAGYIQLENGRLSLTAKGFAVSNAVIGKLLEDI